MTDLPRQAVTAIQRFAEKMGLTAVPARDGSYGFDFEHMGRVSLLAAESGDLLLCLRRRLILDGVQNLAQLAGVAGISDLDGSVVQAGLNRADQPVLIARLPPDDMDATRIELALAGLDQRFAALGW